MLREEVLIQWNNLKLKERWQYQWGVLLKKLDINSLVPQLTMEQVVQEIKSWQEVRKKVAIASERECTIYQERKRFQTMINSLKAEANQRLIFSFDYDEAKQWKSYFNSLKDKINAIDDNESGPTIEEVD